MGNWLGAVGNALLGATTDVLKTVVETRAQKESAAQSQQQLYDIVSNVLQAKQETASAGTLSNLLTPMNLLIGGAILVFVLLFTRRK